MPRPDDTTTDRPEQASQAEQPDQSEDEGRPFRDAESWLASLGVERDPLVVSAPSQGEDPAPQPRPAPTQETPGPDAAGPEDEDAPAAPQRLDDQVTEAVTYARRATATTPLAEARLERKMGDRGYAPAVVEQAMRRARDEGLVDDHAYARALVHEGRDKGHAPLRIETDMRKRELADDAIEAALDTIGDRDPEAQAFAVAHDRAQRLRGVDAETAYRRLVGYLARRGYTEALSRKVARQAVFDDREPERVSGH